MFKNITYKTKYWLLLAGTVIFVIIAYRMAIKKTVDNL